MKTTVNWMRRHKFGMLGLCVAMTAIMIMPEDTDAGWRRRARRCWGYGGFYTQPYSYSNHGYGYGTYGVRGYNNAGVTYGSRGVQAGTWQDGRFVVEGDADARFGADVEQRGAYGAARPYLEGDDADFAPPAPADADFDTRINQRTELDLQGPMTPRLQRQIRQRITTLEGEISQLETRLRDADQTPQRSGADAQLNNRTDAEADIRANDANRQRSGAEAEVDSRTDAEAQSGQRSGADAQLNNQTDADANIESNRNPTDSLPPAPTEVESNSSTDAEAEVDSRN